MGSSGINALYSVYLCWSAVNSNPNPKCNPTIGSTTGDDPEMIALSMAVAAFSLGWTCYNATTATPSSSGTSQVSVYVSNSTGVAQMWVKIISEWFAIGLYTWSLIAPRIFPDREFN